MIGTTVSHYRILEQLGSIGVLRVVAKVGRGKTVRLSPVDTDPCQLSQPLPPCSVEESDPNNGGAQ